MGGGSRHCTNDARHCEGRHKYQGAEAQQEAALARVVVCMSEQIPVHII